LELVLARRWNEPVSHFDDSKTAEEYQESLEKSVQEKSVSS